MNTYEFGKFIAELRKEKGLTQLQLAEQLHISDKAVSRWETGKNYPDIDIFKDLSEIFDISISELLEGKRNEAKNIEPDEQYLVSVSKKDYIDIYNYLAKLRNKSIIICSVIFAIIAFIFYPFEKLCTYSFIIADIFYVIIMMSAMLTEKKNWKEKSNIVENRIYLYDIYTNIISVSVLENNAVINKFSVSYDNIKSYNENENFIIFTDDIQSYFIRKSVLKENTILTDKFKTIATEYSKRKKFNLQFTLVVVFAIFSFLYINFSHNHFSIYLGNACYWMYFLALPFSIGMIALSVKRKKYKTNWIRGFIGGIIITILILCFGINQFSYHKYYDSGFNVITETEKHIGIEIPVPDYINFYKENLNEDSRIEIINEVDMEFSNQEYVQTDINYIEKLISYDVWNKGLPVEFAEIVPYPDFFSESEYSILYNIDTKEINTVPTENGTHRLVIIAYYYGTLDIIEYSITL